MSVPPAAVAVDPHRWESHHAVRSHQRLSTAAAITACHQPGGSSASLDGLGKGKTPTQLPHGVLINMRETPFDLPPPGKPYLTPEHQGLRRLVKLWGLTPHESVLATTCPTTALLAQLPTLDEVALLIQGHCTLLDKWRRAVPTRQLKFRS